jgi:hypothetical protein
MTNVDSSAQIAALEAQLQGLRQENEQLKARPHRRSWRHWAWITLLTLGLLALIPASIMLWLHRTVTTTDGYLKAVGPAIHQPAVQKAIQKASSDAIFQRVDVNTLVGQALPENAQFLADPIAGQVKTYTSNTIGTIVASPRFADVWTNVNRRAQQRFMQVARNSSGDPVVSVSDLYTNISSQLADTRLAPLAGRQLPPGIGNVTVATVPALQSIPHFVAALDNWTWILLLLTLALLAAAIWVAPNRTRALAWTGLGWIITALVTLAIVRVTRNVALAHISDPTYQAGAASLWRTILDPLLIEILVLMLIGLATLTAGWLLGPGTAARRIRSSSQQYLAGGRTAVWPHASDNAFIRFLQRYRDLLRWLIVVLAVIALVMNAPLTLTTTLIVLAVAIFGWVVLEFLAVPEVAARHP